MECSECPHGDSVRADWRCGWIAEEDRHGRDELAQVPSSYLGKRPDVCPGYLVQLPQVIEAARANSWRRDGALAQFYDGEPITELAKTCIDIIGEAMRKVENHNIRSAGEGD